MSKSAITEELQFIVQTASFSPLSGACKREILLVIQDAVKEYGKKRDLIVGSVALIVEARDESL